VDSWVGCALFTAATGACGASFDDWITLFRNNNSLSASRQRHNGSMDHGLPSQKASDLLAVLLREEPGAIDRVPSRVCLRSRRNNPVSRVPASAPKQGTEKAHRVGAAQDEKRVDAVDLEPLVHRQRHVGRAQAVRDADLESRRRKPTAQPSNPRECQPCDVLDTSQHWNPIKHAPLDDEQASLHLLALLQ